MIAGQVAILGRGCLNIFNVERNRWIGAREKSRGEEGAGVTL